MGMELLLTVVWERVENAKSVSKQTHSDMVIIQHPAIRKGTDAIM